MSTTTSTSLTAAAAAPTTTTAPTTVPTTVLTAPAPLPSPPSINKSHDFILYLIIVAVVIVIYYTLFATLGGLEETMGSGPKHIIEIILWTSFIILVLLNGMSYIFKIDVINSLKQLFSSNKNTIPPGYVPPTSSLAPPAPTGTTTFGAKTFTPQLGDQVFHIPGNTYNYKDSIAMCTAFNGRLANYMDLDAAFQKGADWCSYGWSDGQMALFPTQVSKWNQLQTVKGHENDCGRPGINGGYMDNANRKFGVNCYGQKPIITPAQALAMQNAPLYLKSQDEREFDKSVASWREKVKTVDVAPFNHNQWNVL
jgi:hypothetical protein